MIARPAAGRGLPAVRFELRASVLVLAMIFLAWAGLLWREWRPPAGPFAPMISDGWGLAGAADYGFSLLLGAVGMMGPLGIPAARHVALSSFRSRRVEAVVIFIASFAFVWVGFGFAASQVLDVLSRWFGSLAINTSLLASVVAAAGWQLLPWKRTALRDCHRAVPLPPRGWAATKGDLTFGAIYGFRCVQACGGLMLPMFAATHGHLLLGVLATATALSERRLHLLRRRPWLVSVGVIGLAVVVGLAGARSDMRLIGWICAIPDN